MTEATDVYDGPALVPGQEEQDIDPALWLTGSLDKEEDRVGYYLLPSGQGRIKLAMITSAEEHQIRTGSTKINPRNPKGPRTLQIDAFQRNLVAASMNKAQSGNIVGTFTGEALRDRPAGQVVKMAEMVMKVSGLTPDGEQHGLGEVAGEVFA